MIMKNSVLMTILLSALFVLTPVCAQKHRQSKYIRKYDVLQYLPDSCDGNPATFWRLIIQNNEDFRSTMEKFDNPKGSARKAKDKIDRAAGDMRFFRELHDQTQAEVELNEGVGRMMFGEGDRYGMTFSVSGAREWNAYTTPDGHVTVNLGLVERLKKDPDMLCGVVAHEVCHYMYRHHLIHEYKSLKKEKQNVIGAAFGAAGAAMLNGASAALGKPNENADEEIQGFFDKARKETEMARYKYSREEEAEADIAAYRFLEWIGTDPGKMIEALERINTDYLRNRDEKESDHPTTKFRIEMLKQLTPAPWRSK